MTPKSSTKFWAVARPYLTAPFFPLTISSGSRRAESHARYQLIIPDLRGHGESGAVTAGHYGEARG